MSRKVRLTTDPVPSIWLVSPSGKPFRHPVGLCFNSKLIKMDGNTPTLRPGAIARGYRYLRDVLEPDDVALWQEFSAAEEKAKGKLRLPDHLRPRALPPRGKGNRPGPRVFTPAAEMAIAAAKAEGEARRDGANKPAEHAKPYDQRDAQIAELLDAQKKLIAELALMKEAQALADAVGSERQASDEIEGATKRDEKPAKPKADKPDAKSGEKGDAI